MSKQSFPLQSLTLTADGAVAVHRGVGYDGAQATVQGQKIIGVSRYAAATGEAFAADTAGTTVIETGDEIAVGDSLIVDSSGRAIPVSGEIAIGAGATQVTSSAANGAILTGGDLPEFVFADALQAASGAGEFIEVKLR
ncbi:capsid cement protein [Oceanibaculum indicum]|uniref:Lipoprotein n=1 Tax=Oceanibaculum indicum P24 TaxID=1207063 RepID=K2J5T2_9PROT|nr:capsid cement protein [Oceanibaculum indicum]EKE78436.1 lipoprotein [Oceanibaculum indicum P24]